MRTLTVLFAVFVSMGLHAQTFTLKSNEVSGQAVLSQVHNACGGDNISPQLYWENAPEGTKSFALTMYDPDAPTGSGWWHWVIFNIPASVSEIVNNAGDPSKNLAPAGCIQGKTDYGAVGYGGPCPPKDHGFHTYIFTVYALNKETLEGLDASSPAAMIGYYINGATIQKASIVMYYKR